MLSVVVFLPVITLCMITISAALSFTVLNLHTLCLHTATDGVNVSNNVCYRTFGHAFYLEDACEQSNLIIHNLGINPMPVAAVNEDPLQLVPSDSEAAVFWITNPNNTFINNSAVIYCSYVQFTLSLGGWKVWLLVLYA